MPGDYVTLEVNGREADQAAVSLLETAHREIYGRELSGQEVRARIRHALGGRADASVRVYGYWAGVIVTVRGPQDMPRRPHAMTAVQFQRPLAPKLDGITILVLRRQLTAARVGQAEEPVCVQDLGSYQGMILCNSCGWAPVGRVDDLIIPQDETFTGVIAAAIDGCPWDEI